MKQQRRKEMNAMALGMLGRVALSGLLDAMLLWGFARAGVVRPEIALLYAMVVVLVNGVYYLLIRSGVNRRYKDPGLTFAQVVTALLLQTCFLILAPQVGYLFLINFFVIYGFGVLGLSTFWYVVSWLIGSLALVLAFSVAGAHLSFPVASNFSQLLVCLSFILTLGRCIYLTNMLSRMQRKIMEKNQQLVLAMKRVQELATRDELTNIENRRSLMEILAVEQKRFQRGGTPFCIAILDLDGFKAVNDNFGHAAGDLVLKTFVEIVRNEMRLSDHFARYGGDEFVLVLTGTTVQEGVTALDRICAETEMYDWSKFGKDIVLTASIGITDFRPGESIDEAFQRADMALYGAKAAGRNRVMISPDTFEASDGGTTIRAF
ncbi:GGDEF domain-containing protein [Collimonas fungivorans]|uniref:diguanylate cyclase n=1 Tax=Collimonas fungivorans (strain Ter331) TaxID=1005048 RepID=G0AFM6_COLFT|nr:GGDEF domain-containing protein [Collimonas fungivorans]AEK64115.1 putative diguanylate cyclase (GGDEF) [Collimonas fungivorans Ter331]